MDFYKKYTVTAFGDQGEFFISLFHLLLGIAIYYNHALAVVYCWSIFVVGSLYIICSKDQKLQVLFASAYLVGLEVFLRMTKVTPTYEFYKYGLLFFFGLGIFYHGFSSKSKWYIVYFLVLLPGLILGISVLEKPVYSKIVFDFIGPLLLAMASIYCLGKKISFENFNKVFSFLKWPVFTCLGYLLANNISSDILKFNTEANFQVTANYGPNQVATVLGFTIFVMCVAFMQKPLKSLYAVFDLAILFGLFNFCFLTFSRGGTIVGIIICLVFLFKIYFKPFEQSCIRFTKLKLILFFLIGAIPFMLNNIKTEGLIVKRYANKFSNGKIRNESKYGRRKIAAYELDLFLKNPVLGTGLGFGKQNSVHVFGKKISTHNELSRSLAEHGILGALAILILLLTPLYFYQTDKSNFYFWSFYLFWFLTILHSGLRLAMPSFVYALSLLSIKQKD